MVKKMSFSLLGQFSRYLSYIGNIAIAGMMFLSTVDVIGRYFFNSPVLGAYEITEYLMVIMVFSFLAYAQSEKAHISVDIVFNQLPGPCQNVINRVNHFICFILMLILTWRTVYAAIDIKHSREASLLLKIPDYPFAMFTVIGCIALSIEFFKDAFMLAPQKEKEAA